ncbi:MAG: hypothetical protein ACK55Z_05225, partial [bacterium]
MGLLIRARRRDLLTFQGEMLYQVHPHSFLVRQSLQNNKKNSTRPLLYIVGLNNLFLITMRPFR